MTRPSCVLFFGFLLVGSFAALTSAQAPRRTDREPRQLVDGVLTVIRDPAVDDTTMDRPRPFTELLSVVEPVAWQPNFDAASQTLKEMASSVSFQRNVWSLEFGFKPLRVIQSGGKDVWYLVYYVKNNGDARSPRWKSRTDFEVTEVAQPIRFVPSFLLKSHRVDAAKYDRELPRAVQAIAAKERVPGRLLTSSEMSRAEIPVSSTNADLRIWGVATWDNIDPRSDFISIFVEGLTNAYRWTPPQNGYQQGVSGEQDRVQSKALQLNFWRGGDEIALNDREIQYGLPLYPNDPARQAEVLELYNLEKKIDHQWVYR